MDAEGPGRHRPRTCATRSSFADLGDIRGFHESGTLGQVYGLALEKDGYYQRAPIAATALEEPDWAVKLELLPQFMDIQGTPNTTDDTGTLHEGEHKLVKLVNMGRMLVYYGTSGPKALDITGHVHFYTVSTPRPKGSLKAHTTFLKDLEILKSPPQGSTTYLELVLGSSAPSDLVEVLPGLKIKWTTPKVVGFIITNPDGALKVVTTTPGVTVQNPTKIGLTHIYCGPGFQFVRLLFSWVPVSDAYLNMLSNDIDRREAILKALKP